MWNEPDSKRLSKIPKLYATEDIPNKNKAVHLHFFLGSCDWYIVEYDGEDIFFGYAILNGDTENAEWGYVSFNELKDIKAFGGMQVDCELEKYWQIKPVSQIPNIRS